MRCPCSFYRHRPKITSEQKVSQKSPHGPTAPDQIFCHDEERIDGSNASFLFCRPPHHRPNGGDFPRTLRRGPGAQAPSGILPLFLHESLPSLVIPHGAENPASRLVPTFLPRLGWSQKNKNNKTGKVSCTGNCRFPGVPCSSSRVAPSLTERDRGRVHALPSTGPILRQSNEPTKLPVPLLRQAQNSGVPPAQWRSLLQSKALRRSDHRPLVLSVATETQLRARRRDSCGLRRRRGGRAARRGSPASGWAVPRRCARAGPRAGRVRPRTAPRSGGRARGRGRRRGASSSRAPHPSRCSVSRRACTQRRTTGTTRRPRWRRRSSGRTAATTFSTQARPSAAPPPRLHSPSLTPRRYGEPIDLRCPVSARGFQ
jgi:hypothetical protein